MGRPDPGHGRASKGSYGVGDGTGWGRMRKEPNHIYKENMPSSTTQTFVFIRHGAYDKNSLPYAARRNQPLSALGVQQIQAAAEWMRYRGIIPDVIIHTRTERTRQSAQIVADALQTDIPIVEVPAGFRSGKDLEGKLSEWTHGMTSIPSTVLFIGHHVSQDACLRDLGCPLPEDVCQMSHGCVLVYAKRHEGSGWGLAGYLRTTLV